MMKKTQKFSLLELVVIIAVLFVGLSLLLSVAAEMSDPAKESVCRTNLKKFAVSMIQYTQDNDGWLLFPGLPWNEPSGLGKKMDAYLSNQMPSRNPDLFACPADQRPMKELQEGGAKFWMQNPNGKWEFYRVSYAVNLIVTGMPNNQYWKPHRLPDMKSPAECYLFSDALMRDNPGDAKRFAFRHNALANTAFADGSVKPLAEKQVPKWQSQIRQAFWEGGAE